MTLIAGTCGREAPQRLAPLLPTLAATAGSGRMGPAAFAGAPSALWREGPLLVVADARIDDRAALMRKLGAGAAHRSDAALIAQAWLRWGEQAPQALLGDYAFAIFDGRSDALWLVRDALGFRPLCFTASGGGSAFCSLPSPLATADRPAVTPALLEQRTFASRTSALAWVDGVEQVQPGEAVRLRAGSTGRLFWWQPSTCPSFAGTRDDLKDELALALAAAVRDRVGGAAKIATHLSAGLDSMAVTTTAATLYPSRDVVAITARPAAGLSLVEPPGRLIDESAHAAQVAACHANVRHIIVDAGQTSIADDLYRAAADFDQPLTNPSNFGWFMASCSAARQADAALLLIAQAGNFSISPQAGDFWRPLLQREGVQRFLAEWRHSASRFVPIGALLRGPRRTPWADARLAVLRAIDPGLFLKGFARQGLCVADPTADRRLVELTLSVPENLLVRGGDRRWLARGLLRGRVPATVLAEPRRGWQAADWLSRLAAEAGGLAAMLDAARAATGMKFDESTALLRAIGVDVDPTLDQAARNRLAPDLAIAGFVLAQSDRGAAMARCERQRERA